MRLPAQRPPPAGLAVSEAACVTLPPAGPGGARRGPVTCGMALRDQPECVDRHDGAAVLDGQLPACALILARTTGDSNRLRTLGIDAADITRDRKLRARQRERAGADSIGRNHNDAVDRVVPIA